MNQDEFADQIYTEEKQGNYDAILAICNEYLASQPEGKEGLFLAHSARSVAFYHKDDLETAIESATKAIAADPSQVPGYTLRGQYHLINGHFEEAVADVDRAIEVAKEWDDEIAEGGLQQIADLGASYCEKSFRKALQKFPGELLVYSEFSMLLFHSDRHEEGENLLTECLENTDGIVDDRRSLIDGQTVLYSQRAAHRYWLKKFEPALKDLEKSEEALNALIKKNPDEPETQKVRQQSFAYVSLLRADCYRALGDSGKALEFYTQFCKSIQEIDLSEFRLEYSGGYYTNDMVFAGIRAERELKKLGCEVSGFEKIALEEDLILQWQMDMDFKKLEQRERKHFHS